MNANLERRTRSQEPSREYRTDHRNLNTVSLHGERFALPTTA
jgi:hypothetical protein